MISMDRDSFSLQFLQSKEKCIQDETSIEMTMSLRVVRQTYMLSACSLIRETASATSHIVLLPSSINASQSGAGISWATCLKKKREVGLRIHGIAGYYSNIAKINIGRCRGGAKGAMSPFFLVFSKCFTTNSMIMLWKSFYKMLFNSIYRNVNFTLLCIRNTLKNAVCCMTQKVKFSFRGGGGGWGTRPPLSEFSGSAPDQVLNWQLS